MTKSIMFPYALLLITFLLITKGTIDYENQIENYKEEINCKSSEINILITEFDSLVKELEINTIEYQLKNQIKYQFNQYRDTFMNILDAIIHVESSNNDSAYHKGEDAVGCLQIRQTMVNDVNRILKRKRKVKRYTYNDRWDRDKSIEMFNIFINYYGLESAEEIARCWNGGPRGINNPYTVRYWNKVKTELEEINS
jgi:transcriptional regulator of heat shock response